MNELQRFCQWYDIQEGTNNYINVNTTDGSENISFGNTTTNPTYSFLGTGATTFSGNINVNGGTIATNQTTGNVFNTNATTLNIGGAATTYTLGATNATGNVRGTTINFPNATALNASSALATLDSVSIGGGYGSTGISLSNTGDIQANRNLTIDGTSTLTGNVTATGDVAVNGGDITTTSATATLFNTNATTLNIGNAATALTLGATTGITTLRNNLIVSGTSTFNGDVTVSNARSFDASGSATFAPSGTNGVTINTDADSFLTLTGLSSSTGTPICLDGSNHVIACANATLSLQNAYNGGNTIDTSDNRDIAFNLSDTTTDSNFAVTTTTGSTGYSAFTRADGAGTADPAQLVLIQNLDTNRAQPIGLKIAGVSGGNITTGIDLTDSNLTTALALGTNNVSATNFSITGSTGNITTSGDVAVNGGDLTTTNATATLFNSNTTNLSVGSAATTYTIGANTATGNIHGTTITLNNATALNASSALATLDSVSIGGGYGSTGVSISNTGNIQASGTLTVDNDGTISGNGTVGGTLDVTGATTLHSTLGVTSTGTFGGDINANSGTIATTQTTLS